VTGGTAVKETVVAEKGVEEAEEESGVEEVTIIMIIIMNEMTIEVLDVILVLLVLVVTVLKEILTIPFIIITMTNTHQTLIPAARLRHRMKVPTII
jgi:hypothetical protein